MAVNLKNRRGGFLRSAIDLFLTSFACPELAGALKLLVLTWRISHSGLRRLERSSVSAVLRWVNISNLLNIMQ